MLATVEQEQVSAEVCAALADVCGELNAAHARLVRLVARAVETACWEGIGIHSCEQWVALHTGLSPRRAREVVRLARRQAELPATFAAFAAGELSVDQVAVVARHAPAAYEADVALLARSATVTQLRRALSRYAFDADVSPATGPDPDADPDAGAAGDPAVPDERRSRPYLVAGFGEDGLYRLHGALEAEDGAVLDAALREAHDRLFHAGEPDVTQDDALVELARRSLAQVEVPERREAYRAVFHVDTGLGAAQWHCGPVLPETLRRQLLCDADGLVVRLRDGRPLEMGRSARIVPLALRRLVEQRDRGCRVPGCHRTRVQVHHIIHWEDGGLTESRNLVALCSRHHRLVHQGRLSISGVADQLDGLRFTDARGRPLAGTPPAVPQPGRRTPVAGRWVRPTGERLDTHWVTFNRSA